MKRILFALAAISLLGGCGSLGLGGKGKKNVTPTVGERISVLSQERVLEVDPALSGIAGGRVTATPARAGSTSSTVSRASTGMRSPTVGVTFFLSLPPRPTAPQPPSRPAAARARRIRFIY